MFLCSDGVDDNYPVEENEQHLFKLYRTIALTFAEDGFPSTVKQIKDLAASFATKGKGDDTSIAGIVDMDGIQRAAPLWRKQLTREADAAQSPVQLVREYGMKTIFESKRYSGSIHLCCTARLFGTFHILHRKDAQNRRNVQRVLVPIVRPAFQLPGLPLAQPVQSLPVYQSFVQWS